MNKTAAHRSIARRAVLEKVALDNVGGEIGGLITAPVVGTAGGAGLGALIAAIAAARKGDPVGRSAGVGAALGGAAGYYGSHLAQLGGMLAAVARKRRTKKEQQEHDSRSHWENFIPGVSSYNFTKRLGRVYAGVGEPDKEKKAAEAAYVEGFCKAAEAAGVDPVALYKQAGGFLDTLIGSGSAAGANPYAPGIVSKLLANEDLRRAAVSGLAAGTTAALTSDKKNRWRNALLATGLVGGGTYAASATGVLDNFISPYRAINQQAKKFQRGQHAREITRTLRGPDKGSAYEAVRGVIDSSPTKVQQLAFVNTAKK